jgi:uncharacterized cofD-like protein
VVDHTTAVVTVADDGGSSGRLRRDLGVVPPGDLRMALAALSPASDLVELLQYRFDRGELAGHSLGNLVMVALEDLHGGDVVAGLDYLARTLAVPGRVLPCTPVPLTLRADTADGPIEGQVAVATSRRVTRVHLDPATPRATPDVIEAIGAADLVVLGPGSLYTSLLPNLLVPEVGAAVAASAAPVVFIANLREQPGETEGMELVEHLRALRDHVPEIALTCVVAHDGPDPSGEGAPLDVRTDELAAFCDDVRLADLLDGDDGHDPHALATVLASLLPDPVQVT